MTTTILVVEEDNLLVIEEGDIELLEVPPEVTLLEVARQGLPGPTGPTGPMGPTGATGATGAAGEGYATFLAEHDMGGHRVVRAVFPSFVRYADCATVADATAVLGVTLNAALLGNSVNVALFGNIVEPSWAWVEGAPIFVGVDGALTQTPPVTGFQLVVGVATSTTSIFVDVKYPIIL